MWGVIFFAMLGVIPWLRVLHTFRFLIKLLITTVIRTLSAFLFLLILCLIYACTHQFMTQIDENLYRVTWPEAFLVAYDFTWGEDISGWIQDLVKGKPNLWIL